MACHSVVPLWLLTRNLYLCELFLNFVYLFLFLYLTFNDVHGSTGSLKLNVCFYSNVPRIFWSLYILGKLPTYPSLKPKFCPKWEWSVLLRGGVGSFPEMCNDPNFLVYWIAGLLLVRVTCWLFNNSCMNVIIGQFNVLVYPLQMKIKFRFKFFNPGWFSIAFVPWP